MKRLRWLLCLAPVLLVACTPPGGATGNDDPLGTVQISLTGIVATDSTGAQSAAISGLPLTGPALPVSEE